MFEPTGVFDELNQQWSGSQRYRHPLSCIMLDVDRFKMINDTHGHTIGDQVLMFISDVLKSTVRKSDSVCRYGGEEFCVLLPNIGIEGAEQAAEKLRAQIASKSVAGVSVTISLGVSSTDLQPTQPQEMIDQADKALYAAKHTGRDRVARWDQMPENPKGERSDTQDIERTGVPDDVCLPFDAVTALVSALAHRDPDTAAHSRRVADLCVMTSQDLMFAADCYVLEVAGLLHDVGKIGVPDSILLKPGPLTKEEWQVMDRHERIGIEIISAAFDYPELPEIVRNHHTRYGGSSRDPGLPQGLDIPLRARILTIADAFDAMTSDRPYRKAMSCEQAIAELRRCAGSQFDPVLVERFIEAYLARDESRSPRPMSAEKEAGLRIGFEIERLMVALDTKDISTMTAMTKRLVDLSTKLELPQIAQTAAALDENLATDCDLENLLQSARELLDLCHSTQCTFLEQVQPRERKIA